MKFSRRDLVKAAGAAALLPLSSKAGFAGDWAALEAEAKGQTVYFNAWAGSEPINAYIAWAAEQLKARYGVTLEHVKIADTAEVVRRVRDEVKAGKAEGSADLVWINGENFRAMKAEKLLFGPFANELPNFKYVDTEGKPTTLVDFAEPTDGLESPWGMAQLTFFGDGAKISSPPKSMDELVEFAKANPGRVTYPAPPDFHGTTFVKQALFESITDQSFLPLPAESVEFHRAVAPLFDLLDSLHPHLWRAGKQFPQSQAQLKQMLADGELLMALTFNPNEPANLVASGELPDRRLPGSTGRAPLAIRISWPFRSIQKQPRRRRLWQTSCFRRRRRAARLISRPGVIQRCLPQPSFPPKRPSFSATSVVPGRVTEPAPAIPEPHGSWVPLLEKAWLESYGT